MIPLRQKLEFASQPFQGEKLQLKNRFVMPPMITNYATPQGSMTDRQIAYYAARAKGGAGLMIVEAAAVSPEGRGFSHWLCLHDDSYILPMTRITQIAQAHGAKILIQIAHAGRQTTAQFTGDQPVAPSAIPCPTFGEVPRELTVEEIKVLETKFAEAAERAYRAGFDGVEIHGGHGYLIHQFMSSRTNHRSDGYGGDLSGRMTFLVNVFESIRKRVPPHFIIGCRLNGEDYVPGGLPIEETQEISKTLASRGISYLHISCGVAESIHMTIPPMDVEPGFLIPVAEVIKKGVAVPVIAVGRIVDPFYADALIGQGKADLVSMGRALWADPDLPQKAMEGRIDQIRPCIGCNQGCRRKLDRCCLMNPRTGREKEMAILPAEHPKRVFVIGGGPAGMELAVVAKKRGHHVILAEKSSQLGGNFRLGSIPPKREGIKNGLQFFEREIRRLGVEVELEKTIKPEDVKKYQADEVVWASGGDPIIPPIAGVEQNHVVLAEDVLLQRKAVGSRIVIIGGGMVGCELADFLSGQGKSVVLVEMLASIAFHFDPPSSFFLRERLRKQKVDIWTSWTVTQILKDKVTVEKEGEEKTLGPVDSVVLAVGYKPSVREKMEATPYKIRVVGDASKPGDALEAILQGAKVGREI